MTEALAILRRCRACQQWRPVEKFTRNKYDRHSGNRCNRCRGRMQRGVVNDPRPHGKRLWLTVLEPLRPEEMVA